MSSLPLAYQYQLANCFEWPVLVTEILWEYFLLRISACCLLSTLCHSPHVFDLKISTYEQQSKRNDDEGTTVSCCAPYLICLCISNFYCVAHPCLTNVIYIQTTVSVYTIYERQANLIKNRERRENCDTVRCVCFVYSIVYCTTSSTSHISDIFNYLCCRSGGWGDMSMYIEQHFLCCCCCKNLYLID